MMNFWILWILNQSYLLNMYSPLCLWNLGFFACKHHKKDWESTSFSPVSASRLTSTDGFVRAPKLIRSSGKRKAMPPACRLGIQGTCEQGAKTKLTPTKWSHDLMTAAKEQLNFILCSNVFSIPSLFSSLGSRSMWPSSQQSLKHSALLRHFALPNTAGKFK